MFLIGHKTQWRFLVRLIKNQRIPHAMIFWGQEKLGKKKAALEFIKLLNCQNNQLRSNKVEEKEFIPCQSCLSCKAIEKSRDPNLFFLAPEEKEIQINQIKNLQEFLMLRPRTGYFKTAIIDQAESLNSEAQNCLLKTLEEPRGQVLLFLIASRLERLFSTIRSRCQILKFFPVSFSEISGEVKREISETELRRIFFLSQGRPKQIMDFLENPEKISQTLKVFQEAEKILRAELFEKFIFIPKFFGKEISLKEMNEFLDGLENYLRLILLKKTGLKNEILDLFNARTIENYSYKKLKKNLENIQTLKNLISQTNVNLRLSLENLFLNLEPN